MVLVVSITRFPASKAKEVGKKFIEVTKKYPPDKSLEKQILRVAVRIVDDEIEGISITEVKEGKYAEFIKRLAEIQLIYAEIEGYKSRAETFFSGVEALPMVGLAMPE